MKTGNRPRRDFARSNTLAANIVLADPEKFGGDSAGLVLWARTFTGKTERCQDVSEHRQGELFDAA